MRRALHVVLLLLGATQPLGLSWSVSQGACAGRCDDGDDSRGGKCPPICPTCSCSARSSPAMPAVVPPRAPIAAVARVELAERERVPAAADPREILHVPKRLAA